jgi:hypothetical protein
MTLLYNTGHIRAAVWVWGETAGAYTDNSAAALSTSTTSDAFSIFADASDYVYVGLESRFDMLIYLLASTGNVANITHQYWDGDSWVTFQTYFEYDFNAQTIGIDQFANLHNWTPLLITSTSPHSGAPPDNIPRYWIRLTVGTATTAPSVDRIIIRPYASYATPSDVSSILQLGYQFASNTVPTWNDVEDYINVAQGEIEFKTAKAWRPNYVPLEEHPFNVSGFQLKKAYPTNIISLSIWNGSEYQAKTGSGANNDDRTNDYFFVSDTSMVYFSRYFLLPARLQGSFATNIWGWGMGEFQYPIQVSYLYGSNPFVNSREGNIVRDIAKKLAAIDVLNNHDYSLIVPSGGDRIALERKVDIWRTEIEDRLESLRSWQIM